MANPNVFEDFFRRADLDKDGRISGAEAVAFFQGSNLPQVTLAKIWQFADQGQTGFLSKLEFYNALKLVTVAQTGRDLTPDIVRAALAGPAAAQIPAPRIVTAPPPQPTGYSVPPVPQAGTAGFSEQFISSGGGTQSRFLPPVQIPPPPLPSQTGSRPGSASGQRHSSGGFTTDTWPSIKSMTSSSQGASLTGVPTHHVAPNIPPAKKDAFGGPSFQPGADNNLFGGLGGFKAASNSTTSASTSNSSFGLDSFSKPASNSNPKPASLAPAMQGFGGFFDSEPVGNMALVPATAAPRSSGKELVPVGPVTHVSQPQSQPVMSASPDPGAGFGAHVHLGQGMGAPWPRMTQSDAQRYTRVFAEVDTDRDGKITGEQARDLFLSWRLPREVLKQVWDLSDQDGDSMLSLREFCTALYLMERYREGRPLPPVLPTGFHFDDHQPDIWSSGRDAHPGTAQHSAGYNAPSWKQNPGILQPISTGTTTNPAGSVPQSVVDRQMPAQAFGGTGAGLEPGQPPQYKSKAPSLEPHLVNQLLKDEQDTLRTKHKDAEEADKKVYELDKEIMDSKEKIEFYRSKLQEIILFKSRCEHRLGEITERAAADKREMESLAKKYDEKFKQAGEVSSRLLAEESAFRDIQEKKMDLFTAIAKIEEGGDANGLLQNRADRISLDLDELRKALNERSKRLGLQVKGTIHSEAPFGWQPGVQENAADWDEDWDKFDDEGFISVQDFMDAATGGSFATSTPTPPPPPSKVVAAASWDDTSPFEDGFGFTSSPTIEHEDSVPAEDSVAAEPTLSRHEYAVAKSDGSGRSGLDSPPHDMSTTSPKHLEKSTLESQANTGKASQRYANVSESQDFAGDLFTGPTSYSSTSNSFEQGPPSYNSTSDAFGEGGVSWSAAFGHDEEVDSGIRASWGLHSNPPSTQVSLDISSNRASRFGKTGISIPTHNFGDSLDGGSLRITSPGFHDNIASPARSHRDRGSRDSEEYDAFGPLSSKDYDKSPSFFGGNHLAAGVSLFDNPSLSKSGVDRSFARFDSFSSPQNNPPVLGTGFGEEHRDHQTFGRFDSFNSVKTDGARGRPMFGSFDDVEDPFAGTGPFGAGGQSNNKTSWSAF